MNISLPESMKEWVDEQIRRRGYGTASEFVRQLLREERERQIRDQINTTLLESLDSGEPISGKVVFERLRKKNLARRRKTR